MIALKYKIAAWTNNLYFLTAFIMPMFPKLMLPVLVALLIVYFINPDKEYTRIHLSGNWSAVLMIFFYLAYVLGLLWTDDYKVAALDLQIKLPLLIFPLTFYYGSHVDRIVRYKIFSYFMFGLEAAIYFCLARVIFFYVYNGSNYFLYKDFSYFIHPGYFSMYLCLGIVFLLKRLFSNKHQVSFVTALQWYRLVLFSIAIILLASKAGIFIGIIILATTVLVATFFRDYRNFRNVAFPFSLMIMMVYFGFFSSLTAGRMTEMTQTISNPTSTEVHSTAMRLQAWDSAIELIKEEPWLGTGTGDSKDELLDMYLVKGYREIYKLRLNSHNQFLQTALTLGLGGGAFLIFIFLFAYYGAFIKRKWVMIAFLTIAGLNFMIESVLEVSAGCLFFGFFYNLIGEENRS